MAALGDEIVTRIVGYDLEPGNFSLISPNLPVRIAIFGEANDANQAGLNVTLPTQITSAAQAAALAGWGSPIYQVAKILFPRSGGALGGIPVLVYPQLKAGGAAAKVATLTVTGNATASGTHYLVLAGRKNVDGATYAVNIVNGDTPTIIHGKYADAINAVLGAPCTAVGAAGQCTLTAKWSGLTSNDITISVDQGTTGTLGLTYAIATTTAGSGTPDITASLALIGSAWVTHILNTYGAVTAVMDALEAFNGKPVVGTNPASGRYVPTTFKPLIAYTGSVLADPSSITDARLNNLTIKLSPAPSSPGLPMEAAANDLYLAAIVAQNNPHLDTTGQSYPDMPVPANYSIGVMSDWQQRDIIVKKGCSTVDLIGGVYVIQDPVTTYHPVGETVPQYRYARTLIIDWNVRFTYLLNEEITVKDHVIADDNASIAATRVIKPKIWKAKLADIALQLEQRALIVDKQFMIDNTAVALSATNPDRLKTNFKYKRSGYARQADTTAEAGFNYGTLTAN